MWESIEKFVADLWDDLAEFFTDLFVSILSMVLGVIATVIEALPSPDFLFNYSVGSYIHQDVGYFLAQSGFGSALAVVGAAYAFRFLRRVLTLGIW